MDEVHGHECREAFGDGTQRHTSRSGQGGNFDTLYIYIRNISNVSASFSPPSLLFVPCSKQCTKLVYALLSSLLHTSLHSPSLSLFPTLLNVRICVASIVDVDLVVRGTPLGRYVVLAPSLLSPHPSPSLPLSLSPSLSFIHFYKRSDLCNLRHRYVSRRQ